MGLCQSKERSNESKDPGGPAQPKKSNNGPAESAAKIKLATPAILSSPVTPIPSVSTRGIVNGSGTSTPLDTSGHSSLSLRGNGSHHNVKSLKQSSSVLGLDKIIDDRKNEGDIRQNIVHMEVPFGKPIEEVYDGVHDGLVLGSGISGMVRLCTHKTTGVKYAVKSLDLGLVETEEGLQQLREEIAIMCQLDHPNIVRLEEVYESHSEIFLVQELCEGGELFDRLDEQPDYHYSESQCAGLVKQMICSVRYIHSKGIIHRDLKLENFLFSSKLIDSELKMIDFGLSKHFHYSGEKQHEPVGTPYTVSPEVIRGSYDERCDVWAIGVITYLLLSGEPPFGGCGGTETLLQVRENILKGNFEFQPEEIWANVSEEAKEFILSLLVTDPNSRPTAQICQDSRWLRDWAHKDRSDDDNKLNPNVVTALVNFKEYSDMRKLLCEVLSFTLLPEQITGLRKEFEKLDTDGTGEITLKGLKEVMLRNAGTGSLGALTETEVEDIFNAMRIRDTETSIHWHEFIAAGLSQCEVDDRNLKLAFERLDHDHKGFVTFDDVMGLMGRDAVEKEEAMKIMWGDSMLACNIQNAQITYTNFLLLMKGQQEEISVQQEEFSSSHGNDLHVLHEGLSVSGSEASDDDGVSYGIEPMSDISDGPLTMEDDDCDEAISMSADLAMERKILEAVEGPMPPISPCSIPCKKIADNIVPVTNQGRKVSPVAPFRPLLSRVRSKSYDDQDVIEANEVTVTSVKRKSIPERTHDQKDTDKLTNDGSETPLVVNRKLYRAHRQMRLAVLEASKRFEDQQVNRTKADIQAESALKFEPGLVMRRGHSKELSSGAIRTLMKEKQGKQQQMIEAANIRGGRGRRTRKKTNSDMSGMFSSVPANEFSPTLPSIPSSPPPVAPKVIPIEIPIAQDVPQVHLHNTSHRRPTVPGVFHETLDPFRHIKTPSTDVFGSSGTNPGDSKEPSLLRQSNSDSATKLKISVSDGELNQQIEPASPESSENYSFIKTSPSWPPPPPVL